jgi:hypothetical protein
VHNGWWRDTVGGSIGRNIVGRYDRYYQQCLVDATHECGDLEHAITAIIERWGHRAMWTAGSLRAVLAALGFNPYSVRSGYSRYIELIGIDGHAKIIGEHPNWIETSIVEAVKL